MVRKKGGRLLRVCKILIGNLVIFLILAELVGLLAYGWVTRSIYYFNPPDGRSVATAIDGTVEAYRIHPYLGFIIRPDASLGREETGGIHYNNFGFISPFDYPYSRQEGELLVGIFGGSVAANLAVYERRARVLTPLLAAATGRRPEQVRILNFGQGGYKQPQQALTLSYFLTLGQELDFAINIDGFNEIALGARNLEAGITSDMPSIEHVRALQGVTTITEMGEGLERMLAIRGAYSRYAATYNRAWGGKAWETKFAAGFLFDYLLYKYHYRTFTEGRLSMVTADSAERSELSWFYLNGPEQPGKLDWEALITTWRRGGLLFARLAERYGIRSLHLLQPNQYYPTERVFSSEESRVALRVTSPYREVIPQGYTLLSAEAERLQGEGLQVHNLFTLFDQLDEAAYEDDCCHYTDAGNEMVARAAGELLQAALSDRSGTSPPPQVTAQPQSGLR